MEIMTMFSQNNKEKGVFDENQKNIQVIDGARNCTYSIFSTNKDDFKKLFPEKDQDVEFVKDFVKRVGKKQAKEILEKLFSKPINKKDVQGIHGTLFYELEYKRLYYPTKCEAEMITGFESSSSDIK
jgi:hypothetical protein